MPAILRVSEEGIFRFRDSNASTGDKVSNSTIALKATVDVERDAGGSGFKCISSALQMALKSKQ